MRVSIATKIFLAFIAVVVIFTGVLMYGTYRTRTLYGRIQQLNHTVVPISLLLSDVQTDLKSFNVVLNERDPLVLRRTLQMTRLVYFLPARFTRKIQHARALADEAGRQDLTARQRANLAKLTGRLDALSRQAADFAARSRTFTDLVLADTLPAGRGQHAQRLTQLQADLRRDMLGVDQQITALRSELRAMSDTALAQANDNQRSSLYALGGLSAGALALAVGLLVAVVVTLRPLTVLTDAAKRIGDGDYRPIEAIPDGRLGDDEIATLTHEFNAMAKRLAERDAKLHDQHEQLLKSERLATIGRMTSLITHELRNPLSSINLNSEMLEDALVERGIGAQDDELMALLNTITNEVDRLRDITEEYLVYARMPSPTLAAETLGDIVENLVDFHRFEWQQEGIDIDLGLPEEPVAVIADANQLRQALLNLVRNAVEASPDGAQIGVDVARAGDRATIAVIDDGPGIDADDLQAIFEPFFTTKSNGTGLGLAMTQQIVEQHHGRIDVTDPAGHGAAFVINLPVASQTSTPIIDDA